MDVDGGHRDVPFLGLVGEVGGDQLGDAVRAEAFVNKWGNYRSCCEGPERPFCHPGDGSLAPPTEGQSSRGRFRI